MLSHLQPVPLRLLPRPHRTEFRNFQTPYTFQGQIELRPEAPLLVLAMVPVLDPAGFIGLCGNGLTPSKLTIF